MEKAKIDVFAEIKKMDLALDKLEKGASTAKLTKKEREEVIKELEEVIALAENMKTDAQK